MAQISSTTTDNEGIFHLVGSEVIDIRFVGVGRSLFANPDSGYTGYGADGFWYTSGVLDPTHVPFKATWASEGEADPSLHRGGVDRFPDRIFIITTASEVVIMDADRLDVWMRFVPLPGASAGNFGALLGDSSTEIRQASFVNGILVVATNAGIRIADFQQDRVLVLGDVLSYISDAGAIQDRNVDEVAEDNVSSQYVLDMDCLCVDTGTVGPAISETSGGIYVAAVGHAKGLTGIVLKSSSVSSPQTLKHVLFTRSGLGSWEADDDGDGDSTTPYIVSASDPTVWVDNKVRVGDQLDLDSGDEVIVTEVTSARVTVSPEISLTTGVAHESHRPVPSVEITVAGGLIFANGHQLVTRVIAEDWYDGAGFEPRNVSSDINTVVTQVEISEINRVRSSGTAAYVATDLGIFFVSEAAFDDSTSNYGESEFRYSSGGVALSATYEILEGDEAWCGDVVVDVETGNILVLTVDGSDCTVTEIDPSLQQAFQHFDQDDLGGVVSCLVSFRNASGPPDDESEIS